MHICLPYFSVFQDMKNAELALFELSRVVSLEPDHPEVFEQRAEVSFSNLIFSFGEVAFIQCFQVFIP